MEPIGGYFELELRKGEHYHKNALKLNTARNCFEYVLRARKYDKVYIPYYTCEVMLQPLNKLKVEYEFYHINECLEIEELPVLKHNEAILYTNYFGLKQNYVYKLSKIYKKQLIVDNAQAFFDFPIEGIDTFYSARKFFGVPDGAYLYTDCILDEIFEQDKSYKRMGHLLQRIDEGAEAAYLEFRKNDDLLDNQPIKKMSKVTERILCNVNYDVVKKCRREGYQYFCDKLSLLNLIDFKLLPDVVPMVYPFLTKDTDLKRKLISNKIFVATYWPNVFQWCVENSLEYRFAENIVCFPIDQRYDLSQVKEILTLVV